MLKRKLKSSFIKRKKRITDIYFPPDLINYVFEFCFSRHLWHGAALVNNEWRNVFLEYSILEETNIRRIIVESDKIHNFLSDWTGNDYTIYVNQSNGTKVARGIRNLCFYPKYLLLVRMLYYPDPMFFNLFKKQKIYKIIRSYGGILYELIENLKLTNICRKFLNPKIEKTLLYFKIISLVTETVLKDKCLTQQGEKNWKKTLEELKKLTNSNIEI